MEETFISSNNSSKRPRHEEEKPTSSNNSSKRPRHVEEKPTSIVRTLYHTCSLKLNIMFSFLSGLFQQQRAVEETPISSNNSSEIPTSSNNGRQIKNDVFVSFRGEIRDGFLSHLIEAFKTNQINAFVDERLEKGNEVWPSLVEAIEASSISLIIFSEDYACSPWCLNEVVTILKCRDKYGQIVIPVFYKVEPSHVGHQSSQTYKTAFDEYQRKNETNVPIWRDALKKTAKISGIVSSNWKKEAEMVKEIVRLVQKMLVKPAVNSKRLVGIDEKIATIESIIKQEPTVTRVIGIWGMGGLGKTTLAEQVFSKLRREYGGSYFLHDERDKSSKHDFISLKKEIFSQLLARDVNIDLPNSLPTDVLQGIGCIKVLIVLDDVNDSRHIKELLGNLEDFGLGSRIIVTTRNEQVLKNEADVTYELRGLNFSEALELFNSKAFKKFDNQKYEYNKLLKRVVHYAQGIPLVLEVLACHLRGNPHEVWEGELDNLKKMPHKEVYNVMIRSYDDLDRDQQQSFLDIACFFLRSRHVIRAGDLKFLLKDDESGNSVVSNLERLKEKALITFSEDNVVSMHDVLQEIALEIVRRKSIECPGSCRWLWKLGDIYEALKNDKVSEALRSLQMRFQKLEEQKLIPQIFAKMSRLRYLEMISYSSFNCHTLAKGLQLMSTEIRFLNFEFYPLQSLPEKFSTEKLVVLKLQHSNIEKLWDDVKNLVNFKTLDLCGSEKLKELPDLSKAINLEVLLLRRCSMLTSVHPSIFSLPKLEKLDLNHCTSLTRLASDSHLCKLNYLDLSYCENLSELELRLEGTKVEAVPSLFEHQSKLELLNLREIDFEKIPPLDNNLMKHRHVDIRYCKKLRALPDHLPYGETLDVSDCSSLETLPKLPLSLKNITVEYCKSLKTLPKLPPYLKTLNATACISLQTLPKLPPSLETLDANLCEALVTLPELPTSLETLDVSNCWALKTLPELPTSLESLDVSYCWELKTLPELPTSLESLDVRECWVLKTLPELPTSLKTLNVRSCELLKTLPELPTSIETLHVKYCKSLKTLLFPSTAVEQLKENKKRVLFWDCLNLDEHSLVAIGLNAQINMMKFAHHHLSSPDHNHVENYKGSDYDDIENHPDCAIYMYPGSSVPEWLENKTLKDYIIIDLSSAPTSPHWGFIFCFIFGQHQDQIERLEVNLIITDDDGEGKKDSVRMHICHVYGEFESNHVCVIYNQRCSSILNSRAKTRMRVKIQLKIIDEFWAAVPQEFLKGFGVYPISSSTYGNFIQQMELCDRDSKYQIH